MNWLWHKVGFHPHNRFHLCSDTHCEDPYITFTDATTSINPQYPHSCELPNKSICDRTCTATFWSCQAAAKSHLPLPPTLWPGSPFQYLKEGLGNCLFVCISLSSSRRAFASFFSKSALLKSSSATVFASSFFHSSTSSTDIYAVGSRRRSLCTDFDL